MAMMECPNCGEQVSDKAKKCVHCGAVLGRSLNIIFKLLRSENLVKR